MPTYTYRCENCGIQFDEKERFDDPTKTICPECGEKSLHRVYRPVGIVFKGSGFYATDNRSPSGKESRKHEKEENADSKKNKTETSEKKKSDSETSKPLAKEKKSEKKKA